MTRKRYDHLSPVDNDGAGWTVELLRTVLAAAPPLTLYYLAPLDGPLDISTLIGFALGLVVFVVVIIWQVRAIVSSDVPRLRALQRIAVAVSTLLVVFAATYSRDLQRPSPAASASRSAEPTRSTSPSPSSPRSGSATSPRAARSPASSR